MRGFYIGKVILFPLGLYFHGAINHLFLLTQCLCFPYYTCYIWKQLLKGVAGSMCSLKLGKPNTLNKDTILK